MDTLNPYRLLFDQLCMFKTLVRRAYGSPTSGGPQGPIEDHSGLFGGPLEFIIASRGSWVFENLPCKSGDGSGTSRGCHTAGVLELDLDVVGLGASPVHQHPPTTL